MAILSDESILARLDSGSISVTPEVRADQVQPASLDIRLGGSYSNEHTGEVYENRDEVVIEPFTFYLATTRDRITLPADLSAMVSGRSSLARKGLIIHTTAGWIDAGFEGEITLEVFNFGLEPVVLEPGKRVGQLVFFEMDRPAACPYGEKGDAKYQGQSGPTQSRLEQDEKA